MVGTPQYLAPEIVMQTRAQPGYENVVDSWSCGVIVYSMMTNVSPMIARYSKSVVLTQYSECQAMPFDEDPEENLHVSAPDQIADAKLTLPLPMQTRVQRRYTQDFDRDLLKDIGISATGQ